MNDNGTFYNLTGRTLDEIPSNTKFKVKILIDEFQLNKKTIRVKAKLVNYSISPSYCFLLNWSKNITIATQECNICYIKNNLIETKCKHIFCKKCVLKVAL